MKKLILQTIVCCAALLPIAQLQAAPQGKEIAGSLNAKKKIGFPVGTKFTMTVTVASSSKTKGTKVIAETPVPKGLPDFDETDKVKFKIGSKGEIKFSGFSVPFKEDGGSAFVYATIPTKAKPRANVVTIYKDSANAPTGAFIVYVKVAGTGFNLSTNVVSYTMEK